MKKIPLVLLWILLIIIPILIYNYNQKVSYNKTQMAYDNIHRVLDKAIEDEKKDSLSIALALSKNNQLKESLIDDDEDIGYKELNESIEYIKRYAKKQDIYAQILTKDIFVFARSWDETFSGMPLENFRADLKEVVQTRKPKVEIQVGRLLSLKASAPIVDDGETLGTLEVITLLDVLVEKLRTYEIEMIPLMNLKYIDSAYFMDQNPVVNKNLIVANKNFNRYILSKLKSLSQEDFMKLQKNEYLIKDGYFYGTYEMNNNKQESLGKFILVTRQKHLSNFYGNDYSVLQNIFNLNSTKDDMYNYVKYKDENLFLSIEEGYIANFKDLVDEKDAIEFEEVARSKLKRLTKEELIDFILKNSSKKIIDGEIR